MWHYVEGWQRKFGILTLACACVSSAIWILSEVARWESHRLEFLNNAVMVSEDSIGIHLPRAGFHFRHWPESIYLSLFFLLLSAYLLLRRAPAEKQRKPPST